MACKDYKDLSATIAFRKVYDYEGGAWSDVGDGTFTSDAFAYHVSLGCQHCAMPACMAKCPQVPSRRIPRRAWCTSTRKNARAWALRGDVPLQRAHRGQGPGKGVKCDGCADRVAEGKSPICVEACPLRALEFGDIEELRAKHEGTVQHCADAVARRDDALHRNPAVPGAKEPGDTTGAIANEKEVTGVA